jgi:hypothetical protein
MHYRGERNPVRYAKLGENVPEVGVHGVRRDVQPPGHSTSPKSAARAAIVTPAVCAFASQVIGQPRTALLAAFGGYAILAPADFGGPPGGTPPHLPDPGHRRSSTHQLRLGTEAPH